MTAQTHLTPSSLTLSTFPHSANQKIAVDRLHAVSGDTAVNVMFCGGFHSTMQGGKASALCATAHTHGWHYTRFDYRGHGQSDGEPAGFSLEDWLQDTLAVLDAQPQPTVLIGSSMGAWLATLAALRRADTVAGLLLIAAAPDFLQELAEPELTASQVWDLQQGEAIDLADEPDTYHPMTQALLDSGKALSLLSGEQLSGLRCPVRMIHGTADDIVPCSIATRMMAKLPREHDARLTLLHNADHRLSDAASLSYINRELIELVRLVST